MIWTDENLLAAFRSGGSQTNQAWHFILKNWRSMYRSVIARSFDGSQDDADDAMMDIADAFQRRVSADDFELKGKLSSYFVECVKNRWLAMQETKTRRAELLYKQNDVPDSEWSGVGIEQEMLSDELRILLDTVIEKVVGKRCQKILGLFARHFSMEEIAAEMGFLRPNGLPNDDTAKNEKSLCQRKLKQYFLENPSITASFRSYLS